MTRSPAIVPVLVAALLLAACSRKPADTTPVAAPAAAADLIITGGPIVTMEGDQPTTVEAIVVDDGRITFVGSKADALKQQAEGTVLKDLGGRTLMPGFIDGHAHAPAVRHAGRRRQPARPARWHASTPSTMSSPS